MIREKSKRPYFKIHVNSSTRAVLSEPRGRSSSKMAGYWPSSFYACLWAETESRSINSQEMNAILTKLGQLRIYFMAFWEIFLAGHSG